jgi:hypothetical protein
MRKILALLLAVSLLSSCSPLFYDEDVQPQYHTHIFIQPAPLYYGRVPYYTPIPRPIPQYRYYSRPMPRRGRH